MYGVITVGKTKFFSMMQIIRDLRDTTPCRLDHDGGCQEHMWFNEERSCPQQRIKEVLSSKKKKR